MAEWSWMQILAYVRDFMPWAVPFLNQPGVADVLIRYVKAKQEGNVGNPPWSEAKLQAELAATGYFQTTTTQQRSWDMLKVTSPADAALSAANVWRVVLDLEKQLGVKIPNIDTMFAFINKALANGWDANRIKYELLATIGKTVVGGAALGATANQINAMAEAYGLPMSDSSAMDYAMKIQQGAMDMTAVQGTLTQQAINMYPALTPFLERGGTVREYAAPYFQLAVQELGINPAQIDLQNPKWTSLFLTTTKGKQGILSLQDALVKIRNDPAFGYDRAPSAISSAVGLATSLQKMFGAAG